MRKAAVGISIALLVAFPAVASAFPFGGSINRIVFCYNQAIWSSVGPPRGGDFIWTPATQTYLFGPPSHSGQWLLGLASVPYYCLVSIVPMNVYPGVAIQMMGSSQ